MRATPTPVVSIAPKSHSCSSAIPNRRWPPNKPTAPSWPKSALKNRSGTTSRSSNLSSWPKPAADWTPKPHASNRR
nr:MAG TPA: hypothetical protein [Caudoviricetes sp.]